MLHSDLAWLAGIIEGEGCINVSKVTVLLQVQMTDGDVVERVAELLGTPMRVGGLTKGGKRIYIARAYNDQAVALLADIYEWMGTRRKEKIIEALLARTKARLSEPNRDICKRGHPLIEPSAMYIYQGRRWCKHCKSDKNRKMPRLGAEAGLNPVVRRKSA